MMLPLDFQPNEHSIIVGRGRAVKNHSGNRKFDAMVAAIADDYSQANSKFQKGHVLTRLMDQIHASAEGQEYAGFIKKDATSGRWYLVEESLARTAAAQALRNYLNGEYRSSKQFKSKRRMEQIKQQQKQEQPQAQDDIMEGTIINFDQWEVEESTRCVSPLMTTGLELEFENQEQDYVFYIEQDAKTFEILLQAFGHTTSADPFAPTPFAPPAMGGPITAAARQQNNASSSKPNAIIKLTPEVSARLSPAMTAFLGISSSATAAAAVNTITPPTSSENLVALRFYSNSVAV